jgi:hypothetical protein
MHLLSVTKISWLVLFKEIIDFSLEISSNSIDTARGQTAALWNDAGLVLEALPVGFKETDVTSGRVLPV